MRIAWVPVLVMAAACGGGKDSNPAPNKKKAPTSAVHDAAAPVVVDAKAAAAHLKAGRAFGKDKKWKEAVVEIEKAAAADPTSARIWSELGWAAFQVGDLDRASVANEKSVAATDNDQLKAASLYNLGRIAEKKREPEKAREFYAQSVALRPNATVQRRLASMTPGKADVAPSLACDKLATRKELCDCLGGELAFDPTDQSEWEDADAGPDDIDDNGPTVPIVCKPVGATTGIEIWQVTPDGDTEAMHGYFAIAVAGDKVHSIAMLRNNIGLMRRAYNEFTLDAVKKLKVGETEYVRIVAKTLDFEESFGEDQTWKATEVTICPLPTKPGTGCALQIDQSWSVEWAPTWEDSEEKLAEMKQEYGDDLKRVRKLDLTIAADGTATVRLTKGTFNEYERDVTGTYKLW